MSILARLAYDLRRETTGAINLMAREGRVEDLARCYALYEPFWLPYAEARWPVLPEMWRTLLSTGRMHLFLSKTEPSRLVRGSSLSAQQFLLPTNSAAKHN